MEVARWSGQRALDQEKTRLNPTGLSEPGYTAELRRQMEPESPTPVE